METNWEQVVGAQVRRLREARGITQERLTELLGETGHEMHQSTLAKLERGVRPITAGEIASLAEIFEVPVGFLFARPDDGFLSKRAEVQEKLDFAVEQWTAASERVARAMELMGRYRAELEALDDQLRADYGEH